MSWDGNSALARLAIATAAAAPDAMAGSPWPSAREYVKHSGWKGLVRRTKYRWRMFVSGALREELVATVNGHPAWRELHRRHPAAYHPAVSYFMDRRLGVKQRFRVALADLRLAESRFGPRLALRLAQGERVTLWSLSADCRLMLGVNDVSWQEGRWTLSLRDAQERRLYNLSFGFLPCGALLVGSVQGLQAGLPDAERLIRDLTKTAEGMRPPHLLFEALRAAAATWGVPVLLGVDPVLHMKSRWKLRPRGLHFDYRRFWSEVGGVQRSDGYWQIGLKPQPRSLAEVPSRKRAMYRRRWALLDGLAQAVHTGLFEAR